MFYSDWLILRILHKSFEIERPKGHWSEVVVHLYILRKTIEGYLDSVPSLTFNTIKTKLIMHAYHTSRYLQSK